MTVIAWEYERGLEAGLRGEDAHEPADCTCRDSWTRGWLYGKAMRDLRNRSSEI